MNIIMNIVSTDNSLKLYRINKYFTKENICIKFIEMFLLIS